MKTNNIDLVVISNDFRSLKFLKRLDVVNKIIWEKNLGNIEALPLTSEEVERDQSTALRSAKNIG